MKLKPLYYSEARRRIQSGDIGLCRDFSLLQLISRYGRSEYSHAWMFVWVGSALMVAELREWFGGRVVTAASQVNARPSGSVDVYRPQYPNGSHKFAAVDAMLRKAGDPYDYRGILSAAAMRLPGLNRLPWCKPSFDDQAGDSVRGYYPEFCSAAISNALRRFGGIDPVPNLADANTEPGDLGRSSRIEYVFTIERNLPKAKAA